jgi:hypothetical protein
MDIYKSRERGREDVGINTGNIEALALSGDTMFQWSFALLATLGLVSITKSLGMRGSLVDSTTGTMR